MAGTRLDLSDEQLASLVSAGIITAIGEAGRDALLKDAIKYLLTPNDKSGGGYSYPRRTPLQDAFDMAIEETCRTMVREMFKQEAEIQEQIKGIITEGFQRALANREPLINAIADGMAKGFREHL